MGFVDADDTIAKDFFKTLFTAAEENSCDVVFSKWSNNDTHDQVLANNTIYSKSEIIERFLPLYLEKDTYNCIWNKLYLNAVIKENHIQFPLGKKLGEDAVFNLRFLAHTNSLYYLNYNGYYYREVIGSATRNVSVQNYLEDALQLFVEEPLEFIRGNLSSENIIRLKSTRFIHQIISLVYIYSTPKNGLSLLQKIKKLNILVHNITIATVFSENNTDLCPDFSSYQKQIYNFIKAKEVFPLYFLSLYSYYRNL